MKALLLGLVLVLSLLPRPASAQNRAAQAYLSLLENFAGWCEEHWNAEAGAFDAAGKGVTWPRGNGGVCLTYAVLLTEFPERQEFSPRKIRREVMIDHARRAIRAVALANKTSTHAQATKANAWGGKEGSEQGHWQSGLETEHWVVAAHLLAKDLDEDTKTLVRQVATAEADLCIKEIPQAKPGNTAADDCCWNAGLLGVCAAIYADDPRAVKWDEWAKRWALNTEAREPDRNSMRMVDGKPLGEWLVSTQVFPDLTLENHGFWDLPYQVSFAAHSEPIVAYAMCGKKVPEALYLNGREEGEEILKWMLLQDGDLLGPQGLDWAERDVQHQWAFTELGTLLDMPWARAAEARCLRTLQQRQAAFGDGSLHALDFGYQTDLANCWCYSFLLHKYFGKGDSDTAFEEPRGAKIFPYVSVGVFRTPEMVSSVSWYGPRQAVMVVPNDAKALGEHPSLTAYRGSLSEGQLSGLGYLRLAGDKKLRWFRTDGEAKVSQEHGALTVSFSRAIKGVAQQEVGYSALPSGEVVVFSKWIALADLKVQELADHPYYWLEIPGWLPKREAKRLEGNAWSIADVLRMTALGGSEGRGLDGGLIGSERRNFETKKGEVMQESVCVYQAIIPGKEMAPVTGTATAVEFGPWKLSRGSDGGVSLLKR